MSWNRTSDVDRDSNIKVNRITTMVNTSTDEFLLLFLLLLGLVV
jgi:hypothetical protein